MTKQPSDGPTLADAIRAAHDTQQADPLFAALCARARELHEREGEIEIDEITAASGDRVLALNEGGAYVLAWVWVDIPTTDADPAEEYEAAAERLIAAHQAQLAREAEFAPEPSA